jgi:hypothetical protein
MQVQNPQRDRLVIPPWTEMPSGPLHANSKISVIGGSSGAWRDEARASNTPAVSHRA